MAKKYERRRPIDGAAYVNDSGDMPPEFVKAFSETGQGNRTDLLNLSRFTAAFRGFQTQGITPPKQYIRDEHLWCPVFLSALDGIDALSSLNIKKDKQGRTLETRTPDEWKYHFLTKGGCAHAEQRIALTRRVQRYLSIASDYTRNA